MFSILTMMHLISCRIDDTILKLKLQQEHKLEKWHKGLGDIDGWVMKTKVKVDAERSLASDVDSALEQMDDFQVCSVWPFVASIKRQNFNNRS